MNLYQHNSSSRSLHRPKRSHSATGARPSTSGGETCAQPQSEFLRERLNARRAEQDGTTTPSKASKPQTRTPSRQRRGPPMSMSYSRDDWMGVASEDEAPRSFPRYTPSRQRRLSIQEGPSKGELTNRFSGMGIKETNAHFDKISKENFDLKLRITMQDGRISKLNNDLEEALARIERTKHLEQKNERLREARAELEERMSMVDAYRDKLEAEKDELTALNDDLVKELETRDEAIYDATTLITTLEKKVIQLEQVLEANRKGVISHQDSTYFSADPETEYPPQPSKSATASRPSTANTMAHDSDYYSAESSSANNSPRTPRAAARRSDIPAPQRMIIPASDPTATPNTLPSLRTSTSGDSYLSNGPNTPATPAAPMSDSRFPRMLSRKPKKGTPSGVSSFQAYPITRIVHSSPYNPSTPLAPIQAPEWSSSRPLRNLYMSGELNRKVHSHSPVTPPAPLTDSPVQSALTTPCATPLAALRLSALTPNAPTPGPAIPTPAPTSAPTSTSTTPIPPPPKQQRARSLNRSESDVDYCTHPDSPHSAPSSPARSDTETHYSLPSSIGDSTLRGPPSTSTVSVYAYGDSPSGSGASYKVAQYPSYPAWPPSGGLKARQGAIGSTMSLISDGGSMFSGAGMEEMFRPSPPRDYYASAPAPRSSRTTDFPRAQQQQQQQPYPKQASGSNPSGPQRQATQRSPDQGRVQRQAPAQYDARLAVGSSSREHAERRIKSESHASRRR